MLKLQENGVFGLFLMQFGAKSQGHLTKLVRTTHRVQPRTASVRGKPSPSSPSLAPL